MLFTFAQNACSEIGGLQLNVEFTEYSPLSSNSELMRRMLSPFARAEAQRILARSGKGLSEQSINLADEKFVIYVPSPAPLHGYALLVFVPPWQDAKLPQGWASVMDQYGLIYVSAANSGNDENVLARRAPLALIAAQNIIRRYAVDPERVYIAGFSGGSRVAMHLALAYPDVFRGALLIAGSDPIGNARIALPSKELFLQFQNSTRLIYVTGEEDLGHLGMAAVSIRSMQEWCVSNVDTEVTPRAGHELADSAALSRALNPLLNPVKRDPDKLAACKSAIEAEMTAKLRQVQSLIAGGKPDDAHKLLMEIDRHFGGLAAPRSVELESTLNQSIR
jgi:predicted esterase